MNDSYKFPAEMEIKLISSKARGTFSRSDALWSCLFRTRRALDSRGCLVYRSTYSFYFDDSFCSIFKAWQCINYRKRFIKPEIEGMVFSDIFGHIFYRDTFFPQATNNVCLINRASSYSELLAKRTHLFPLRLSFNTLLYCHSHWIWLLNRTCAR